MKKVEVALLSGGISQERDISILSGDKVMSALNKDKFNVHRYDPKYDLIKILQDASNIDVALIILHGPFGEDGSIQGFLDLAGIPYQGSGVLASALAMDKKLSKLHYKNAGLTVAEDILINSNMKIEPESIADHIGLPLVIKPLRMGSSFGMSIPYTIKDLNKGIKQAFKYDNEVIVEEYIKGVEITGGIIGNNTLESLPLVEIIPDKDRFSFFDTTAKYTPGATEEICPARLDPDMARMAQEVAVKSHRALGCRGYSRTDMIVSNGKIYVLETNTIPGMTSLSLFPQAALKAGYTFPALLEKLIYLAMEDQKKII